MKKVKWNPKFDYYVLLFFLLSFIGWLWEVLLFLFTQHCFVNRGVYKGPYLPIYGVGGLLLIFLFRRLRSRPLIVFGSSALVCAVLEYLTSFFLERRWGIRWWDYSGHFLNLNGRICLLGVMTFGIGGTLLICLFLPWYEKLYVRLSDRWKVALCIVLILIFAMDGAWCAMRPNTGEGIAF